MDKGFAKVLLAILLVIVAIIGIQVFKAAVAIAWIIISISMGAIAWSIWDSEVGVSVGMCVLGAGVLWVKMSSASGGLSRLLDDLHEEKPKPRQDIIKSKYKAPKVPRVHD